jgi:hypothetical protein
MPYDGISVRGIPASITAIMKKAICDVLFTLEAEKESFRVSVKDNSGQKTIKGA